MGKPVHSQDERIRGGASGRSEISGVAWVMVRVSKLTLIDQDEPAKAAGEGGERSRERAREAGLPRREEGLGLGLGVRLGSQ